MKAKFKYTENFKKGMKKHKINYNLRYFLWTILGIFLITGIVFATTIRDAGNYISAGNVTINESGFFINNTNTYVDINGDTMTGNLVVNTNITADRINEIVYVKVNNGSDIQVKLDSCSKCEVRIPMGTYTIISPLNYTTQQNIIGAGARNTIISAGAAWSGNYMIGSATPSIETDSVLIKGLTFDCNNLVNYGVWFNTTKISNVKEVRAQECNISNFYFQQDNWYSKLEDVTGASAVINDILIDDNEVIVSNARLSAPTAINITNGNNINIEYASIDGSGTNGIWIDSAVNINLIGNRYEGYTNCLVMTANADYVQVFGGRFSGCGTDVNVSGVSFAAAEVMLLDSDSENELNVFGQGGTITVSGNDGDELQLTASSTAAKIISSANPIEIRSASGKVFYDELATDNRIILRSSSGEDWEIRSDTDLEFRDENANRLLFEFTNSSMLRILSNVTDITCNSTTEGGIYYDGSTKKHYGCNSTTWNALY